MRETNSTVSVVILTYNEEENLPRCLESVKGLKSEVFVIDSGSTDRTKETAEVAGAQVVQHAFENYAAQRNWAQNNLPIKSEWVLHLDADERLTPELVAEIRERLGRAGSKEHGAKSEELRARSAQLGASHQQSAISHSPRSGELGGIDGFLLRKRTFFMGRWIRHGGHYPSYHLRLFRKDKGFCEERLYDQHFVVNVKVEKLKQ